RGKRVSCLPSGCRSHWLTDEPFLAGCDGAHRYDLSGGVAAHRDGNELFRTAQTIAFDQHGLDLADPAFAEGGKPALARLAQPRCPFAGNAAVDLRHLR